MASKSKSTEAERAIETVRQATNNLQHVQVDGAYSARAEWEDHGGRERIFWSAYTATRKMLHVEVNDVQAGRRKPEDTVEHYMVSVTLYRTFATQDEAAEWAAKALRA